MKKNERVKYLRWIILAFFLVLITVQGYLHQIKGGGEAASIHALCPYGGLESLYSLIGSGKFIEKIFSGTIVLLILTLIIAVFFRRSFCGLICPFGALQEFFALLGKKIFRRNFIMPSRLDKNLRYTKYLVLIITIYYAWKTAGLWMSPYDPWAAFAHISEGIESLIGENLVGFVLLIITILGSIIYDRFFCKYLCPMGAVYGIVAKVSPHRIVRNKDKCISCNLCNDNCPMNIDVANAGQITSAECINCQLCVLSCPKDECLEIKQSKKMLKPAFAMTIIFGVFFGGIIISDSIGLYNTLPAAIPTNKIMNTDEIRGYMTLKEVSKGLKIDIKELYKKLNIPKEVPEETKLKEVKEFIPDFSVEEAKDTLKTKS